MESIIGLVIWVIVLIIIISRMIPRVPVPEKEKKEEKKEEDLARLFETIFTGQLPEETEIPEPETEEPAVEESEISKPQVSILSKPGEKIPEPVIEAEPVSKLEPVGEQKEFQGVRPTFLKNYFPKDLRQAIILREIIGPPKAL